MKIHESEILVFILLFDFHSADGAIVPELSLKILLRCVRWQIAYEEPRFTHDFLQFMLVSMFLVRFVIVFTTQRSPFEVQFAEKLHRLIHWNPNRKSRKMHKNKQRGEGSRAKKRKAEDEYSLKTILEDDASNDDAGGDVVEPRAAARNAEKNDESVRFRNISQSSAVFNVSVHRPLKMSMELKITGTNWN